MNIRHLKRYTTKSLISYVKWAERHRIQGEFILKDTQVPCGHILFDPISARKEIEKRQKNA